MAKTDKFVPRRVAVASIEPLTRLLRQPLQTPFAVKVGRLLAWARKAGEQFSAEKLSKLCYITKIAPDDMSGEGAKLSSEQRQQYDARVLELGKEGIQFPTGLAITLDEFVAAVSDIHLRIADLQGLDFIFAS